jgi:MATE family multidrug resistance protein
MLGICLYLSRDILREWWPKGGWVAEEEWTAMGRLFRLGFPVGLQQGLEVWGFSAAGIMVGWQGESALAAHTLCLNLASISFMIPLGIGIAAGTRVGNLLGAGKPWGVAAWTAVAMGLGVMSISGFFFSTFPAQILGLYRPEAAVLAVGVSILPIAGAFQLFDGVQAVSFGVLRGAGDMRMPALANVIGYYCVGLPLGWYLSQSMGARGIWMGLTLSLATVAILLVFRIRWTLSKGGFRLV